MTDKEKLCEAIQLSSMLNEREVSIVKRSNYIEVEGIRRFIFDKDGTLSRVKEL